MIKFNESKNVYLYSENIDMRMGINEIQILIACNFNQLEIRHSVFVFCSNNGKTIKMYYEDDYGSWLLQNRLHEGKFKWPKGLEIGTKISKGQLEGLRKGLEVIESKKVEEAKKIIKQLQREKEEALVKLYETNKKLDEVLLTIATYQRKIQN